MTPLPLEYTEEYDAAAEYYARTNHLPENMGRPGAYDWINGDPDAFWQRVNDFRYAAAMSTIPDV